MIRATVARDARFHGLQRADRPQRRSQPLFQCAGLWAICRFMGHHPTWSLRGVGRKAANPECDRSDFLVGDGLPLGVSCMRSSTILEGSRRDEISRLISGIFSHHSAEYLAHMIASPAASRQLVKSTTEARLCAP